jgi:MoaA/NifB/PqqE/SkfB family radical SAM enzyme
MVHVAPADLHEWADAQERNVLVLNYTMTCPLRCSFCCYGCHPGRHEKMPLEKAKDLITQASSLESFSSVAFTGGEVFSHEADLIALSYHLRLVGLPFTVATAGHWGSDATHADAMAQLLVHNGLRRANIRYDDTHAEFADAQSIVNAARALAIQRIPVYVVGTFTKPRLQLHTMLPDLVNEPFIKLITKQVAKVGRAKKAEIPLPREAISERVLTCYRRIHHDLVVFWDGRAYPCCSTFNRATRGLSIGNAFEEPLRDLWLKVEHSLLFKILKRNGFERLFEVVEQKRGRQVKELFPPIERFPGACSLCNARFLIRAAPRLRLKGFVGTRGENRGDLLPSSLD